MPANLTHVYLKAEQAYRQAQSPEEELEALQVMLRELPKHKGTDKLQAELKQRISRAKEAVASPSKSAKRSGFRIPRQGAGRAVVIGAPNAGKSQFIDSVTKAQPTVAEYPFTTQRPQPAMMPYDDVVIQLIDTPPITSDFIDASTLGLIRGADLVLFLVDASDDQGIDDAINASDKIESTKTRLGLATKIDEHDVGCTYTKTFLIFNKNDLKGADERRSLFLEFRPVEYQTFSISSLTGIGLEDLKRQIFESLEVVRIYTKMPTQKEADFDRPFTIKKGGTLIEVAELIHRDLVGNFKFARVWGTEVHDGTIVRGDYVVHDRDVVEIHS